jgi:hypothetical protein
LKSVHFMLFVALGKFLTSPVTYIAKCKCLRVNIKKIKTV